MAKPDGLPRSSLDRLDGGAVLAGFLGSRSVGITIIALDGRIAFASDAFCRMTGFEPPDLIAHDEAELIHPDDAEASRRDHLLMTEGQTSALEFERRYVRKDGGILWTKGSASLQRDRETDEPLFIASLITDVTGVVEGQDLLDKALLEKERLALTLHSIGDAVICTDASSLVTFMNPVAERLTGWSEAEALARPVAEVFNLIEESSGKRPASPTDMCIRDDRVHTVEGGTILMSRTGDAFDIGYSAAPVKASAQSVLGSIVIFNDLTKDRADQKRVARSAYHDALTGLPNRVTFMIKLQSAINEAKEQDRTHALCFIDLDRFKLVNDQGGHAAGDAVLCHVAKLIALSCTSKDVPARLGGDEFALLIRDCSAEEAEATASAIVQAIDRMEFRWENQIFRVGASIGATMVTRSSPSLAETLDEADRACYSAKNSGRGQVRLRKPRLDASPREDGLYQSKSSNIH